MKKECVKKASVLAAIVLLSLSIGAQAAITIDTVTAIAGWQPEGLVGGFEVAGEPGNNGGCVKFSSQIPTDSACALVRTFKVIPARKYSLSLRIRSQDLQGPDSAATVCVEWTRDGFPVDRSTPNGPRGTTDWKQWNVGTFAAPVAANAARVKLYVSKGTTGSIWWDDLTFLPVKDPVFDCILVEPNYRGWMYGDYLSSIKAIVKVNNTEHGLRLGDLRIDMRLINSARVQVSKTELRSVRGGNNIISLKRPDLSPGDYSVEVRLFDAKSRKALGSRTYSIAKLPDAAPDAKCWIDRYGRLMVDDKPFFPLGLYLYDEDSEQDLKIIADAGFNAVMPYIRYQKSFDEQRTLIKFGDSLGVKTIYSVKDFFSAQGSDEAKVKEHIDALKDTPGVIAWYLSDEIGPGRASALKKHYDTACKTDPNHPCWIVDFKPENWKYFESGFDSYGLDWYPISWLPIDTVGIAANATRRLLNGSRSVWAVPQIHNLKRYAPDAIYERPPTLQEMRNMSYQFLCAGANGLIFYSYCDLYHDPDATFEVRWAAVKKLAEEFKPMIPILLSVDKPMSTTVVGKGVMHLSRRYNGKTYLYLVNTNQMRSTVAKVKLSDSAKVTVNGGIRALDANMQIGISLRPLDIAKVEIEE